MPAPIAEVPPLMPRRAPQPPPRALSVFVVVGLALGLFDVGLMILDPPREIPAISAGSEGALSFFFLFLIHFLPLLLVWRGANWARWLYIAAGALTIMAVLTSDSLTQVSALQNIVNWLYLPYNLAMIVFLFTPAMRRYFAGHSTETPPP